MIVIVTHIREDGRIYEGVCSEWTAIRGFLYRLKGHCLNRYGVLAAGVEFSTALWARTTDTEYLDPRPNHCRD